MQRKTRRESSLNNGLGESLKALNEQHSSKVDINDLREELEEEEEDDEDEDDDYDDYGIRTNSNFDLM